MSKLLRSLLVPLLLGLAAGCLLRVHPPERNALACSCATGGFWVVDGVSVEGPSVAWPADGQLYPTSLALWIQGFSLRVFYSK
jgi:hypothetical protein